jgi:hypothetical protein
MDYVALDLSEAANAGLEAFGDNPAPPSGEALWHGLPFRLGSGDPSVPWLVALGPGGADSRSLTLQRRAEWLIFAHVLVDAPREAPATLGHTVAEYAFSYEDGGAPLVVPIRDRFEVAGSSLPGADPALISWGHLPFAAVTSERDDTPARYGGPWGDAGGRLTEAVHTWRAPLFLWPWRNPEPERRLERITLHAQGRRLLVCAITLSELDEEPFPRDAAREVIVTLRDAAEAARPFALEVDVDRGSSGYPYLLSATSPDAFSRDALAGYGDERNAGGSPAYVRISATPSATVSVRRDGVDLGAVNWGELQERGTLDPAPALRIQVVDRGRAWVRTRVVDDETGEQIPCRIHFRSHEGIPFAPHGHHAHINSDFGNWNFDVGADLRLGQATYAYIDGECEGWLPLGKVAVDLARGFEYEPVRRWVEIEPGRRELTLRMRRIADLKRERWFSGDTHVHFLSTQGSHLEAAGEGLSVVNLLLAQWGHHFTNTEEFTGSASVSAGGETIVFASQENRQHVLGHLSLLGLKRPVYPWSTDGPDEAGIGEALETTLSHWADACHAQGGTVVVPHFPAPNGEPAALIATGRADAIEMVVDSAYGLEEYYRYLNAGYRMPLAGGTDKMSSDVPVGLFRTYVHLPEADLEYDAWCRGLRSGATFISSGPLLRFSVDGRSAGGELRLPAKGGSVQIEASVSSIFPLSTLEIVQGGRVVLSADSASGARELHLSDSLEVERGTWLAARCTGAPAAARHRDEWERGVMAHTSPVYVTCGDAYDVFDAAAAQYMLTLVEGSLTYVRERARTYRPPVSHHHGEPDHRAFLERPFHEATAALHRLMHQHGIPH